MNYAANDAQRRFLEILRARLSRLTVEERQEKFAFVVGHGPVSQEDIVDNVSRLTDLGSALIAGAAPVFFIPG